MIKLEAWPRDLERNAKTQSSFGVLWLTPGRGLRSSGWRCGLTSTTGVSVTPVPYESPVLDSGVSGESTRVSASFIEENGLRALLLLLVPVVLTAVGVLTALITGIRRARHKQFLWISAVLLLGFCGMGMFSIGLFYLPAAVVLIVAASKKKLGHSS